MPNAAFNTKCRYRTPSAGAVAIWLTSSLVAIHPAAAQQEGGNAPRALEEVVVTAQRREERLLDVPLTVNALSGEQLEDAGVTNIFDLQNVVSGLTFGGVGNLTQPALRGVSTMVSTNGSENPNALYIDGVYHAQPHLLGANLPDVERIEVLKGPQGTLFGRNSVGGAIRIFTKGPTFEPSGDFRLETGMYTGDGDSRSAPRIAASGFVSVPLTDETMALSVSGGYDWTPGFLTNEATGERYGDVRRVNARTKLLLQPSDQLRAVFNVWYLDHDDEGLQAQTPLDGLVVASAYPGSIVPSKPYHTAYDSGLGIDFKRAWVKSHGASANVSFDLEQGTITSITAWNESDIDNLTTLTHSAGSPTCIATFSCIDYGYGSYSEAFSQEINFASRQFEHFSYTAGLFYFNQTAGTEASIQGTIVPGAILSRRDEFEVKSYAGYGEVQITPTEQLTFIVGARYTYEPHRDSISYPITLVRKETFESFIPRLTVKYGFSPELSAYATYAVGEKSGLTGVVNQASTPPYAAVDPEENHAYEVGLKYGADRLTFSVAAFYNNYKDKQEQGFTGSAITLQNTGPVRIYGMDLETSLLLTDELTARFNASWVPEAEYRDFPDAVGYGLQRQANGSFSQIVFDATGYRLAKAPEFTANLTLSYERSTADGIWDASSTLSYSSTVYHDNYHMIEQEPYATLSAQAGYRFATTGIRAGVYGRNLTNEDYFAHGFPSGQGFTVAYARPREIGLSLSYSY